MLFTSRVRALSAAFLVCWGLAGTASAENDLVIMRDGTRDVIDWAGFPYLTAYKKQPSNRWERVAAPDADGRVRTMLRMRGSSGCLSMSGPGDTALLATCNGGFGQLFDITANELRHAAKKPGGIALCLQLNRKKQLALLECTTTTRWLFVEVDAVTGNPPETVKAAEPSKAPVPPSTPSIAPAPPPTAPQPVTTYDRCVALVQGKVQWDLNDPKATNWNPENLRRLCSTTTNPEATVTCFRNELKANGNDWSQAISDCTGN